MREDHPPATHSVSWVDGRSDHHRPRSAPTVLDGPSRVHGRDVGRDGFDNFLVRVRDQLLDPDAPVAGTVEDLNFFGPFAQMDCPLPQHDEEHCPGVAADILERENLTAKSASHLQLPLVSFEDSSPRTELFAFARGRTRCFQPSTGRAGLKNIWPARSGTKRKTHPSPRALRRLHGSASGPRSARIPYRSTARRAAQRRTPGGSIATPGPATKPHPLLDERVAEVPIHFTSGDLACSRSPSDVWTASSGSLKCRAPQAISAARRFRTLHRRTSAEGAASLAR
jgi:hypothetical protein